MNQFAHLRKGRLYQFSCKTKDYSGVVGLHKSPFIDKPIGYISHGDYVIYLDLTRDEHFDYLKVLANDQVGWIPCLVKFRLKRITCRMLRRAEQHFHDHVDQDISKGDPV